MVVPQNTAAVKNVNRELLGQRIRLIAHHHAHAEIPDLRVLRDRPVPGSGCGSRRITSPIASFENARLCVVTGELPVFEINCDRNT